MSGPLRFTLVRLAYMPIAILFVTSLAFFLVNISPGDIVRAQVGGMASEANLREMRHDLGLDQSIVARYSDYLKSVSHGDLGTSWVSKRRVADEIREKVPNSLELIAMSLGVAVFVGVGLGVVGAWYRNALPDRISRLIVSFSQSIPDFFLGLILVLVFSFYLGWAPAPVGRVGILDSTPKNVTGGAITDSLLTGNFSTLGTTLAHSVLPVLSLGLVSSAYFAKVTRATLTIALESRQVEYARALGLSRWKVATYAFRECRTPVLTYGAMLLASLVGGDALIETVFSWGGLGQWAVERILDHDQPAIQAFVLVTGLLTLATYVTLEIVAAWLDPRISLGRS